MQFASIDEEIFRKNTDPPDKAPNSWLTQIRERTNKAAYGKDSVRTVQTGFPEYKDWLAKKRAQSLPGKTLVDHNHPPLTATVTQATKAQANDPDVPFVEATFSTKDYYADPSLTSHPIKQYISDKVRYVPQGNKDPFIPMSAKPVPPVMNQSCIEAAAKMFSIARHLGQDVTQVDKVFRWMWNLPENFTLEPYALQIDPEVTKPWLRLKQAHNYEVPFMIAQQGMIKVTTGSETGVHASTKWDIDWAWVRTVVRNIMTRICFVEDHPLTELEGLKLKFIVRYDNLLPQAVPKYTFKEHEMTHKFNIPEGLRRAIMKFNEADVATLIKGVNYTEILSDMQPLSRPVISTLPRSIAIRKDIAELADINWLGPLPPYRFIEPVALEDSIITKQPISFQSLYEQYTMQRAMTSQFLCKKLFECKAYLDDGSIPLAYVSLNEFIDRKELDALIMLYLKMRERSNISKREIWLLFLKDFDPPKKLKELNIDYMINTANQILSDHFLWVTTGALKILRQQFASPNILQMYKYVEGRLPTVETAGMVRARIKHLITSFYKVNYKAKVTAAKEALKLEKYQSGKNNAKNRLIRAQLMVQLYTALVDADNSDHAVIRARDILMMTAYKYCNKRRRYGKKLSEFVRNEYEVKVLTGKSKLVDPEELAKALDKILDTSFYVVMFKAATAYADTENDLDVLFLTRTDYLIKYSKSQKQDRRLKGVMNSITQRFIAQKPDHDYFFAEAEKKERFRDLLFRDNEQFIKYEQLTKKSRVQIKPYKKPDWIAANYEIIRNVSQKPVSLKKLRKKKVRTKKSIIVLNEPDMIPVGNLEALMTDTLIPGYSDTIIIEDEVIKDEPKIPDKTETLNVTDDDFLNDLLGNDDSYNPYGAMTDDIYLSDYIATKTLPWTVTGFTTVYSKIDPYFNAGMGISMAILDGIANDQVRNNEIIAESAVEFGHRTQVQETVNVDIN